MTSWERCRHYLQDVRKAMQTYHILTWYIAAIVTILLAINIHRFLS